MQLIFGKDVAAQLQERYTVLELETLEVDGCVLEVFCVVPAEKIALTEITTIEHSTKLHNDFVDALKRKDYKICQDLSVHLIGRFGGEVDTFYEEILKRISSI
jgi:hypothetical protein